MNVVHLSDSLNQAMGGPPRSIVGLCEHLAPLVDRLDLCGMDLGADFGPWLQVDDSLVHLTKVPCRVWKSLRLYIPRGLASVLRPKVRSADIFHSHGLWAPANTIGAAVAAKARVPLIISPRGSFDPAALARSAWKKTIFKRLYVNRALRYAACLHALSEHEADCIRQFGLTNPIAIVPNAVSILPGGDTAESGRDWGSQFGRQKLIVFLGRLHPIKGLDILIEAWGRLAGEFPDWSLVLAGPDENGYLASLESQVRDAGLVDCVFFPGGVYGPDKDSLLAASEVFVLASGAEGMSVALLEAMGAGLPVVITKSCNFPQAEACGGGFVADAEVESLAEGLAKMLNTPRARRLEMGASGASLVSDLYSWESVAGEMLEVYRWILGMREAPRCVRTG
ncbi:MAG: glycosyltransferase [Phycisphaerae bacterium]|jgi:poly(glycerol-phosphate) alpha-glucosyltransferase|nr:glycosyltransferase [Phycisphaerae bacterium]